MESNIAIFHTTENRTMAFRRAVKPERWSRILIPVDDMTQFVMNKALGEGVFEYRFTWRTNSDIIGVFIGCLVRANIQADHIIRLCRDLYVLAWRKGLEQAVYNIDHRSRIPYPEKYMNLPFGHPDLDTAHRRQSLVIREYSTLQREWPKIEASLNFILRWRGIIVEENTEWLTNYLRLFKAHIQEGVSFANLNDLEFSTPNAERTSKRKLVYEFPPNYQIEEFSDIMDVILVLWKEGRGPAEILSCIRFGINTLGFLLQSLHIFSYM